MRPRPPPAWHTKSANGGGALAAGAGEIGEIGGIGEVGEIGEIGSTSLHLHTKVGSGGAELAPAWLGVRVGAGVGAGAGVGLGLGLGLGVRG